MNTSILVPHSFDASAHALAVAVRDIAQLGWAPATSGNFSLRVSAEVLAITISGRDKTKLSRSDIMAIDLSGTPIESNHTPSAETLLHTQIYRHFPAINVVLHTHSKQQTIASRLYAKHGFIRLQGYELLKAFDGYQTHDSVLDIPVFENTQSMQELAKQIDVYWTNNKPCHGYLINGHGIYTWGKTLQQARQHLDALEFLLGCELEMRKLAP